MKNQVNVKNKENTIKYTIEVSTEESEFIQEKAKKESVTPEEHIKTAALNNGRRRMKDKINKIRAEQALSFCNKLIAMPSDNNAESLNLIMQITGVIEGICLN